MVRRAAPALDDLVATVGAAKVLGHVREVHGRASRRYVVVRLTPEQELSGHAADEETPVTFPLDQIRRVEDRETV